MTVHSVFCFKFYFTCLFGILFTFPSRYSSLSVIYSYLGSRMVPLFYVLLTKGVLYFFKHLLYGTITLFGSFFQKLLIFAFFAYFAFVRHYLRNLFWILFLLLLRCFTSQSFILQGFPQEIHISQSFSLHMTFRIFTSS